MKQRKLNGRHDSAGSCDACGSDLDRFGQCTNVECETNAEDDTDDEYSNEIMFGNAECD